MLSTHDTARRGLSTDELEEYRSIGLVVPSIRLPDDLLARLRRQLEEIQASNLDVSSDVFRNVHLPFRGDIATGIRGGGGAFLETATLPEILDRVADCIGPDILLWGTQLFAKPAGTGKEVPWHQDGHFYCIDPLESCSVWIALDDVDTENGCMRYIPGSHKLGLLEHMREDRADVTASASLASAAFDASQARDDVLGAGQMSIHDVNLIHGSMPNRSDRRRVGFVIRYMPATSHYDHHHVFPNQAKIDPGTLAMNQRPLWLVRGANRNAANDLRVGHAGYDDIEQYVASRRGLASA